MKKLFLFLLLFLFSTFSQSQFYNWIQTIGLGGNNYIWDIQHDSQNNIIATGRVKFTVKFGHGVSGELSDGVGAETDAFVVKFDSDGNLLWWDRVGDVWPDWGRAITVDNQDNIYVAGEFCKLAVFGNDTIYGYDDGNSNVNATARSGYISKYDPSGNLLWVKPFEGEGHCRPYGVTVDSQGNSYITGTLLGAGTFGANTTGTSGENVAFYAKYNSNGDCIWVKSHTSSFGCVGESIEILDDENIVVTGYYKGTLDIQGNSYAGVNPSWGDFFITRLDSSGNFIWNNIGTGNFQNEGYHMIMDSNKNTYVVGHFAYIMNFGSITLNSIGQGSNTTEWLQNSDSFIAKYDYNGNLVWVEQVGNEAKTQFDDIDIINDNQIVVSGYSIDSIFLQGIDTLIPSPDNHNTFIIAYDTASNYLWSKSNESDATPVAPSSAFVSGSAPTGLAIDANFNIYVGGYYYDDGIWDEIQITADNGADAWIAKMYPPLNGTLIGDSLVCENDTIFYLGDGWGSPLSYSWITQSGQVVEQSQDSLYVVYQSAMNDTLTLVISNSHDSITIIQSIDIGQLQVDLGTDFSTCDTSLVLNAGSVGQYYDWGSGFELYDSTLIVNTTGSYSLVVESNGCFGSDSIYVTLLDCADLDETNINASIYYSTINKMVFIKSKSSSYMLSMYDLTGKIIEEISGLEFDQEISLNTQKSGIYILRYLDQLEGNNIPIKIYIP